MSRRTSKRNLKNRKILSEPHKSDHFYLFHRNTLLEKYKNEIEEELRVMKE